MSRSTTTTSRSFSVYDLRRWRKLEEGCTYYGASVVWSVHGEETARIGYSVSTVENNAYVQLTYKTKTNNEEWTLIDYKVPLEAVSCNFGGKRWFFRCPLNRSQQYCGRRVAVLYQIGDYFGCRHCADLTYESCNESKRYKSWPWKTVAKSWKADQLYDQLRQTHYRGKPTRKYRRYLSLLGADKDVQSAVLKVLE
jgi:hypothetical protein